MTLLSRKENGFGRAAAFLLVTQIGVLDNQTVMVEIKIVCLSTEVIRNGMISIVIGPIMPNLCVKLMLEINQQNFFVIHF